MSGKKEFYENSALLICITSFSFLCAIILLFFYKGINWSENIFVNIFYIFLSLYGATACIGLFLFAIIGLITCAYSSIADFFIKIKIKNKIQNLKTMNNYSILGIFSIIILFYAGIGSLIFDYFSNFELFYIFLRWVITIFSIITCYKIYQKKPSSKFIFIGLISVLFNPIAPIHFEAETWRIIDIITMIIFIFVIKKIK